ncbi:MAG: FAD-dependent oxidoreductase [Desulfurococcales archaeon]|nr:FAD-dependent oxidoreductase [Desulfurococcales archaeon]
MSLRLRLTKEEKKEYTVDVAIVGTGPAGIAAGIYCARYMLSTVLIGDVLGGQVSKANVIENYPGFPSIKASELIDRFASHLSRYNIPIINDRVDNAVRKDNGDLELTTRKGYKIRSSALIIATGAKDKELGVPGEKEFVGRGVSYCSTCDAAFFYGANNVVVVGGGDTAFESAYLLTQYAKKVTLVHRRSEFRAQPILVQRVRETGKVEFVLNAVVKEIYGDEKVKGIIVQNVVTGETTNIPAEGVFINIGYEPEKELAKKLGVNLDEKGYIVVSPYMETNIDGIFAAGDVTNLWVNFKQIITSAAQGAVAAYSAYRYIMNKKKDK